MRIEDLIRESGGEISIERFMEEALYNSEYGYYSESIRTIGRRGDFSTAATIHSVLGSSIARWAVANRGLAQRGLKWSLIEIGGGDGRLAKSVLSNIPWRRRLGLKYQIVEISPVLKKQQQERLKKYDITWRPTVEEALKIAGGRALIFSNELVDAFPCVQILRGEDCWREVRLIVENNEVQETFSDELDKRLFSTPSSVLADMDCAEEGQRCEIHLSYFDWLSSWIHHLESGMILTIDYGDQVSDLYYRRPRGTLRGYFFHNTIEGDDVYKRFARQDLTADVNFTDLKRWGKILGLKTNELSTQRDFILSWVSGLEKRIEKDPALAFMLDPMGMGSAYKVLQQVKI